MKVSHRITRLVLIAPRDLALAAPAASARAGVARRGQPRGPRRRRAPARRAEHRQRVRLGVGRDRRRPSPAGIILLVGWRRFTYRHRHEHIGVAHGAAPLAVCAAAPRPSGRPRRRAPAAGPSTPTASRPRATAGTAARRPGGTAARRHGGGRAYSPNPQRSSSGAHWGWFVTLPTRFETSTTMRRLASFGTGRAPVSTTRRSAPPMPPRVLRRERSSGAGSPRASARAQVRGVLGAWVGAEEHEHAAR